MNGDPTTSWTDRERRKTWQRQREREKGRGRLGFSAVNETKSDRKGKQAGRHARVALGGVEAFPTFLPSSPGIAIAAPMDENYLCTVSAGGAIRPGAVAAPQPQNRREGNTGK